MRNPRKISCFSSLKWGLCSHSKWVFLIVVLILDLTPFLQAQVDYRGQDISGQDLSEQDLTGALFDNTTIFSDGANGVNLSNTGGTGANLSAISGAVDFRGVNLTGVNFFFRKFKQCQR